MTSYKVKGIIFDMDNTILRSKINFGAMKEAVFQCLVGNELLHGDFPITDHTTSTILEHVQRTTHWNAALQVELWDILKEHELLGMQNAELEQGAREVLQLLHGTFKMVIMTNNSDAAALSALSEHGIDHYFDTIIGREQMKFMKPAPDGLFAILAKYPELSPDDWISVGDAWIDGKASQGAGVKFIAYRADSEKMKSRGVIPDALIDDLAQLVSILKESSWTQP
ncbi:phosphoglycolate phosphatase [Paenibacillus taihuensis]|uniref:Phosphoglycolate phosphatase n=1 Tax=Paenibacillus taihuensis TaxID=1156355 RepID=A0A3D9SNU5_9BACL|nr:HAD hydrolase-like protein [Paenibacillus taihuensis]REE94615.1 phosphoglycolate phosphatase [Paenibacillus taihuensis]